MRFVIGLTAVLVLVGLVQKVQAAGDPLVDVSVGFSGSYAPNSAAAVVCTVSTQHPPITVGLSLSIPTGAVFINGSSSQSSSVTLSSSAPIVISYDLAPPAEGMYAVHVAATAASVPVGGASGFLCISSNPSIAGRATSASSLVLAQTAGLASPNIVIPDSTGIDLPTVSSFELDVAPEAPGRSSHLITT